MSDERITISISVDVDLSVADVWPDDDHPEHVTAAAVRALMEAAGSKGRVLQEWCLLDDLDVSVRVSRPNPEWRHGKPPPGERVMVSKFLHESARVWDRFAVAVSGGGPDQENNE